MALVFSLSYMIRQRLGLFSGVLAFVVFWLAFEYIHYHWELSWPFMNLGNWFGQKTEWIQWYEYTGVLGGTLWVLLVNALFYISVNQYIKKKIKPSIVFSTFGVILILLPIIISKKMYNSFDEHGPTKNFTIIQPNIDPYTAKYESSLFKKQIARQIKLAFEAEKGETNCFVFPESSFPVYLNEDSVGSSDFFQDLEKELIGDDDVSILGGFYSYKIFDSDTLFYNTAFMIKKSAIPQLYHKSKLVIGVEKMPFQEYFSFLKKWNLNFGGYSTSLVTDSSRNVFVSTDKSLKIAPVICYESVYGEFVSSFIEQGANCIAVITNDAWWGDTPGYMQHLMHSQLRAIENRKYVVRSANTGISCFINAKGEIVDHLKPWKEGVLQGNITTNDVSTFYCKNGDLIGKIALCLSVILLLVNVLNALNKKLKQDRPKHGK